MRLFQLTVLFCFCGVLSFAHPWKPNCFVVVDTDCGLDDFRAINLMLAEPNIQVLAITVSDGIVPAEEGYIKVKSLLNDLHQGGILVGLNRNSGNIPRTVASDFSWGSQINIDSVKSFNAVFNRLVNHVTDSITFISLGSLSTLNKTINYNADFIKKLSSVIWMGDFNDSNYNYCLDMQAAQNIKECGLPLVGLGLSEFEYSYSVVFNLGSGKYAQKYKTSLARNLGKYAKLLYDEWAALYISDSMLWKSRKILTTDSIQNRINDILKGGNTQQYQTFNEFPINRRDYQPDISPFIKSTIQKFGFDEWAACALTNELHRHVGVYSLIGAKMGVRAKEYFGCGVDQLKLVTCAGQKPPLSCLNDGLQVSTGATLGHGLISVSSDTLFQPVAVFEYLGQRVRISLKDEYRKRIYSEVHQLSIIHGLNSNTYWDLVRLFALNCWFNWDRNSIFFIEPLF